MREYCGPAPAGFQLTPPRGGRRYLHRAHAPHVRGFNSRPREGGDRFLSSVTFGPPVSTHAPARGATGDQLIGDALQILDVSTHAPARGATGLSPSRRRISASRFQLTPPRGGRRRRSPGGPVLGGFNSRPREGGDARA